MISSLKRTLQKITGKRVVLKGILEAPGSPIPAPGETRRAQPIAPAIIGSFRMRPPSMHRKAG